MPANGVPIDRAAAKRARILAGLDLTTAAKRIGKSTNHLAYIESGERRPSPAVLLKIADAYGVDTAALLPAEEGAA